MIAFKHGDDRSREEAGAAGATQGSGTQEVRDMATSKRMAGSAEAPAAAPTKAATIARACAANGFSEAAAAQMIRWRAGGAASNAWLERYKQSIK